MAAPRLTAAHLPRPYLLGLLDAARGDQVVLLSAPAGYGKTLLLADWASARPGATAWVSLDEDDNDDRRLWSAVLTALALVAPAQHSLHELAVPARPGRDPGFLATVLDLVDSTPGGIRLVLDDVHELTAADPLHGLAVLVRDRPPGLQLLLASRADPPLPLGRMRLHGQLCELRAAQLRFSVPEAQALLAAADVALRPDQVHLLIEQTEGWPAGMRLAALSLRGSSDLDGFLADFVANSRAVSEYLVGEILDRLPDHDRELLGAISICEQLSASLAVALSGRADAGEVLDELERSTALVTSSGCGRLWYRVHPLLRSHLRADLERRRPDRVAELHRRAARWHAEHGRPAGALQHARRAGDAAGTVRLLHRHALDLVADGQLRVLREALRWLDAGPVTEAPWLAALAALVAFESGDTVAARTRLDEADACWPVDPGPDLVALRERMRTRLTVAEGDTAAVLAATGGADPADPALAIMKALERSFGLALAGRPAEARLIAQPAVDRAHGLGYGLLVAQGLTVLATVAAAEGDYRQMIELADSADREAAPGTDWVANGGAAAACLLRALGALMRLEPAECLARVATVLGSPAEPPAAPVPDVRTATCLAIRGGARLDLGHDQVALDDLRAARVAAGSTPPPALVAMIALLVQQAGSAAGRHEEVRAVLRWAEGKLGDWGEVALLRARRLTDSGRHREAGTVLAPLLDGTARPAVPWALVDAWALDCRLALLGERRTRARHSLRKALELTEASDARRPLAAGPPEVLDLMVRQLGGFGALDATARRVLRARHALGVDRRPAALTDREHAVLRMLPSQRSFHEIADDLTVAHSTVKTHVRAIYRKLDVDSRRAAVDRARRHGLLLDGPV